MTLYEVEVFFLVFFSTYLILALVVNIFHHLRHIKSTDYRIAVIIFAFLTAAMFVYLQAGRETLNYPFISNPASTNPTSTATPNVLYSTPTPSSTESTIQSTIQSPESPQ